MIKKKKSLCKGTIIKTACCLGFEFMTTRTAVLKISIGMHFIFVDLTDV